jgi:hypothetical protein
MKSSLSFLTHIVLLYEYERTSHPNSVGHGGEVRNSNSNKPGRNGGGGGGGGVWWWWRLWQSCRVGDGAEFRVQQA